MPGPYPNMPFPQWDTSAKTQQQTPAYGMDNPYAQGGISSIPPEILAQLLGTQGDVRDLSAMEKQLAQAEALRDDNSMPEGRSNGRVYTAANPLEFIGKGLSQYGAMRKARQLEKDTQAKRDLIKANEQEIGSRWARGRGVEEELPPRRPPEDDGGWL